MELTRERVDAVLEEIQTALKDRRIIDAIKIVRIPFDFTLKEAHSLINDYRHDLDPMSGIREDLYKRAGLNPDSVSEIKARVFKSPFFRLEVKGSDVTKEQLQEFFSSVASEL